MKTNPIGVRFEIEDLDFIKKRESIKTNQGVVDFLLSEYCKLYRVEKPSVFNKNIGVQDYTKSTNEIKPFIQPETNYSIDTTPHSFTSSLNESDRLRQEIYKCNTVPEIEKVVASIKASFISLKEKQLLEAIAKDQSKDFFTD